MSVQTGRESVGQCVFIICWVLLPHEQMVESCHCSHCRVCQWNAL